MTYEQTTEKQMGITVNINEILDTHTNGLKNIGFIALSKLYHELGIPYLYDQQGAWPESQDATEKKS